MVGRSGKRGGGVEIEIQSLTPCKWQCESETCMRRVDGTWHHKARVLDKAYMSDGTDCV